MSFYAPKKSRDDDTFDEVIDLHGYSVLEVRNLINELVQERAGKVRLIVGRGLRSEYIPVLPNAVANCLREHGILFDDTLDGVVDVEF